MFNNPRFFSETIALAIKHDCLIAQQYGRTVGINRPLYVLIDEWITNWAFNHIWTDDEVCLVSDELILLGIFE